MSLEPAIELDLQNASSASDLPDEESFRRWAGLALHSKPGQDLTIRLVDDA